MAKAYFTDGLFTDAEVQAWIDSRPGAGGVIGGVASCPAPRMRSSCSWSTTWCQGPELPAVLGPGAQPDPGRGAAEQHRQAVPAAEQPRAVRDRDERDDREVTWPRSPRHAGGGHGGGTAPSRRPPGGADAARHPRPAGADLLPRVRLHPDDRGAAAVVHLLGRDQPDHLHRPRQLGQVFTDPGTYHALWLTIAVDDHHLGGADPDQPAARRVRRRPPALPGGTRGAVLPAAAAVLGGRGDRLQVAARPQLRPGRRAAPAVPGPGLAGQPHPGLRRPWCSSSPGSSSRSTP